MKLVIEIEDHIKKQDLIFGYRSDLKECEGHSPYGDYVNRNLARQINRFVALNEKIKKLVNEYYSEISNLRREASSSSDPEYL